MVQHDESLRQIIFSSRYLLVIVNMLTLRNDQDCDLDLILNNVDMIKTQPYYVC